MITTAVASFVLACVFSAALTALAIRLSPRIGLVDRPDQQRKLQAHPVPLGGGAAVFLATVAVLRSVDLHAAVRGACRSTRTG